MGDRVTYVGHGTVLIELAGTRLLTDPLFRERFLHVRRQVPAPDPAAGEAIDAVLVSTSTRITSTCRPFGRWGRACR